MFTFWPLPDSWEFGKPAVLVVELYPPGGSAGNQPETREDLPSGLQAPSTPPITEKSHSHPRPQPKEPRKKTTETVSNRKNVKEREKTGPAFGQEAPGTMLRTAVETSGGESGGTANESGSANGRLSSVENGLGTISIPGNGKGQLGSGTEPGGFGQGSYRASPLGYGSGPQIPYPKTARRRGWEGEVLLKVAVTANGKVVAVQVEKSSGYGILDQTAREAVALWTFRPARRNGQPIADTVLVPVRFELENGP